MKHGILFTYLELEALANAIDAWVRLAMEPGGRKISITEALSLKPLRKLLTRLQAIMWRRADIGTKPFKVNFDYDELIAVFYTIFGAEMNVFLLRAIGKLQQKLLNLDTKIEIR